MATKCSEMSYGVLIDLIFLLPHWVPDLCGFYNILPRPGSNADSIRSIQDSQIFWQKSTEIPFTEDIPNNIVLLSLFTDFYLFLHLIVLQNQLTRSIVPQTKINYLQ